MGYTLNTMTNKKYWWRRGFIVDGNKVICTKIYGLNMLFRTHEAALYEIGKLKKDGEINEKMDIFINDIEMDMESGIEKMISSYRYSFKDGKLELKSTSVLNNEQTRFVTKLQEERYATLHIVRKLIFAEWHCNNSIYHGWDTRYQPDWVLSEKNVGNDMVQCRYKNQKWLRPRTTYSDID